MGDVSDEAAGEMLRNIMDPPAGDGPPFTHTLTVRHDSVAALGWLRHRITWWLNYARKNAAQRPITPMRGHEMRHLAATCEAHLAILDEHQPDWDEYKTAAGDDASTYDDPATRLQSHGTWGLVGY